MVTKQQQLEWLAKRFESLPLDVGTISMSAFSLGCLGDVIFSHKITREEWQQERDKMQKKAVQPAQQAQPTQDNSWHERGEFPPAGCECEVLHRGKWIKTVIIGMSPYKSCVYSLIGSGSDYAYDGIANSHFFRPLRTEREKAIDEMISVISSMSILSVESIAEKLYDAGCRMEKPQ